MRILSNRFRYQAHDDRSNGGASAFSNKFAVTFQGETRNVQIGDDNTMIVHETVNQSLAFVQRAFGEFTAGLDKLPPEIHAVIGPMADDARREAVQIESGDQSDARQTRLLGLLKTLRAMSGDIGQVLIATLANPAGGVALAVQKIAQKAQAGVESPDKGA